jgi:hypothetical protein
LPLQRRVREAEHGRYVEGVEARFRNGAVSIFCALPESSAGADHENFTTSWAGLKAVDFAGPRRMQPNCAFGWREFRLIY